MKRRPQVKQRQQDPERDVSRLLTLLRHGRAVELDNGRFYLAGESSFGRGLELTAALVETCLAEDLLERRDGAVVLSEPGRAFSPPGR